MMLMATSENVQYVIRQKPHPCPSPGNPLRGRRGAKL